MYVYNPGSTSEGTTDSKMTMVTVPVLSAVIGVLAVILITSIIMIIIAARCVFMMRRNKGKEVPLEWLQFCIIYI